MIWKLRGKQGDRDADSAGVRGNLSPFLFSSKEKQDDGNVSEEQETAREVLKQENEPAHLESLEVRAEASTKPADGLAAKKHF